MKWGYWVMGCVLKFSRSWPIVLQCGCSIMFPVLLGEESFSCTTAAAKPLQSCPTLCDPIDGSPPGSPIPGILQARILEWVAISFSSAWQWKVKVKSFSRVQFLATPWTAAHQAPPPMGFSRQEYWSGVPLPSPPAPLVLIQWWFCPQGTLSNIWRQFWLSQLW